jgi:hypothetical protein
MRNISLPVIEIQKLIYDGHEKGDELPAPWSLEAAAFSSSSN